jgi:hypothetical protein
LFVDPLAAAASFFRHITLFMETSICQFVKPSSIFGFFSPSRQKSKSTKHKLILDSISGADFTISSGYM